jgi:hypothetical protein
VTGNPLRSPDEPAGLKKDGRPTWKVDLRTYDDHSDVPQPAGPVGVEVPDGATEAEIVAAIERDWADPERPYTIQYDDGRLGRAPITVNGPGWRLFYLD